MTERTFNFGDLNEIEGENFQGKSTIAEGIVVGLRGVNLEGSNRLTSLIKDKKSKAKIEIEFTYRNKHHRIIREISKKKNQLYYNHVELTQTKLDQLLKWGDIETFLYIFLPCFAVKELKDKKGREFFTSHMSIPNSEEVLHRLDPSYLEYLDPNSLNSPDYQIRQLRDGNKEIEKELDYLKGIEDTYQNELIKPVPPDIESDLHELIKELNDLECKIELQKAPDLHSKEILVLEDRIRTLESEKANKIKECDLLDTVGLEREITRLREQYKLLEKSIKETSLPYKAGDQCPTCTQIITHDIETIFQLQLEKERNNRVAELDIIKQAGIKAVRTLEEVSEENFSRLKTYHHKEIERLERIDHKIMVLKMQKKEIEEQAINNNDNLPSMNQLLESKERLSARIEEYKKISIQRKILLDRRAELEKKILNLQFEKNNYKDQIFLNKEKIKALLEYSQCMAQAMKEHISHHFTHLGLELFQLSKSTGELKPVFKLCYKEIPIDNCSLSERIRAGLEIGSFLKKVTGESFPTFIDNAESITDYDFDPSEAQLFTASVVADKELSVNVTDLQEVSQTSDNETDVRVS